MTEQPQVKIGDVVLYTANLIHHGGVSVVHTYPAIVTSVEQNGLVNLATFFDHTAQAQTMVGHPTSVPFDREIKAHTWCFTMPDPIKAEIPLRPAGKSMKGKNKKK